MYQHSKSVISELCNDRCFASSLLFLPIFYKYFPTINMYHSCILKEYCFYHDYTQTCTRNQSTIIQIIGPKVRMLYKSCLVGRFLHLQETNMDF